MRQLNDQLSGKAQENEALRARVRELGQENERR